MRTLLAVLLVLIAMPAAAQSIDALATISQFESGNRNIQQQVVPTSASTASGYYQITNTTWNGTVAPNTGLPTVGPGTSNPNGVVDLSQAQQTQGASYLFQQQGFQPWTCSGCDAPLANYVAQNGGASNFGLLGDPLNTAGTGGAALAPTSAGGGGTAMTVTPGSTQISHPFTSSYTYVQNVLSQLTQAQNTVLGAVQPTITIVATLAIGIIGILMMAGILR